MALAVETVTTVLAVAGMGYFLAAIVAARVYLHERRAPPAAFAPGVSILKSLKGLDPGMMDAFRSHCLQNYAGEFELLFGVSSLDDLAVSAVEQLKAEFPERPIHLVECPERLGTNGKVSTLVQLSAHASHDFLLINDSDITVSPRYLERVMARFAPAAQTAGKAQAPVGMVTALYRGRAHGTLGSRLEALGIATDFMAGVLLSKMIEGGLHYGLGSTLAVSREALEKAGGLLPLVDYLADDYELGARVAKAGYRVVLNAVVVETAIPAYEWSGFVDHQVRWAKTVRDARPGGYVGLMVTHGLGWALLNLLASGLSPVSLWLLGLSFFLRLAQAMTVGAEVLGDHEVLASLWLLPLRDVVHMGVWVAGFAGNTIVWRGERFVLKDGKLFG
ncbi:MAG TPA: bacteriohopanetetrol glucosamine biosynthesis glycosyltransferase HpnI [Terracidiphilus sp.]|nr:bacteriohopanetetrol glucosamine biosynthesis glycosyltransferase HpnI [Terracidiphilus sp.]